MILRVRIGIAAAAVAIVVVACGADDRPDTPSAAPIAAADFGAAYAEAACDFGFRCCTESERSRILRAGAEPDLPTCLAVQGATSPAADAYDPQEGGDCVATIRALPCGSIIELDQVPACRATRDRPPAPGGGAIGQPCTYDSITLNDDCAFGGYCDLDSMICVAERPLDASCESDRECGYNLLCEPAVGGHCSYDTNGPGCVGP